MSEAAKVLKEIADSSLEDFGGDAYAWYEWVQRVAWEALKKEAK